MQLSLEELLSKAASEPAYRPAFFQRLLQSDVWVAAVSLAGGGLRFDPGYRRRADGQDIIPFFTSEQAFAQVAGTQRPCLTLTAAELFALSGEETLCLNPELESGKIFTAAEIRSLLTEQGNALSEFSIPDNGQTLLLSQVDEPPEQLVASLKQLFSQYKPVRRAFLAWCKEGPDEPANLLIGIEAGSDLEEIIQAAGHVAIDTLPGDALIDFCEVSGQDSGVSHFFSAHITPFYQRPHGSFLRGQMPAPGQRIL